MYKLSNYVSYRNLVDQFDICQGDIVLVGSDITRIAVQSIRNGEKLDLNIFIDSLMNKIGESGTLLFPTFNWGFCNGETFDYNTTVSKTGALTNAALKREDFTRTQHPIYSFAVWGKDKEQLYNMNNKSSFGEDSPFAYLYRNKAKMLTIDLCYQNSFTFVHYVEEMEKVDYRYIKDFTSKYIDKAGNESIRTYSMNVRDLDKGVVTKINPIGEEMESRGTSRHKFINNVDFYVIDLNKSYEVIREDIIYNDAKKLFVIE